jgi:hypothetical protein
MLWPGNAVLGYFEDLGFGFVKRSGHVVGLVVAQFGNFTGYRDEPTQQCGVLHNAGVPGGVGDGGGGRREFEQQRRATDVIENARTTKFFGHRDGVNRLAGSEQQPDGLVDVLMSRLVEVTRIEAQFGHAAHGIPGEQKGAQEGLFGRQVVRRHAPGSGRTWRFSIV